MSALKIMVNGEIFEPEKACISLLDYGFLFGDHVYEVLKSVGGRLFAADLHLSRLRYSAEKMGLPVPWSNSFILEELKQLGSKIPSENVYFRVFLTRGKGPLFFDPSNCEEPVRIYYATEFVPIAPSMYQSGVDLTVSAVRKGPSRHQSGSVKTGNYMEHILPRHRAQERGFHEALMVNHCGEVTECTSANIFWFKDGELFTPALETGLLKGVTRDLVLLTVKKSGISVREGHFTLEDLSNADEVFITSTTRDILPVRSIDKLEFQVGEKTRKLMQAFLEKGFE